MLHTLRPVGAADAPFLRLLYAETHGAAFAGLPPALRDQMLDLQLRARAASHGALHPQAIDAIVEQAGRPVGRLLVARGETETTLLDVAVTASARGRGLGGALLAALCAEGRPITLHVANDNPARRLYARHGFVVVGEAPPYLAMRFAPAHPVT